MTTTIPSLTEMAARWFEHEPCVTSCQVHGWFKLHHGPTGITVTRLNYADALLDLWNLVGRERRPL